MDYGSGLMDTTVTDMFGNPLKLGDCISYPGRVGSSLFVNLAIFISRKTNGKIQVAIPSTKTVIGESGSEVKEVTRKTSVEVLDRVIKVPDSFLSNVGMSDEMQHESYRLLGIQDDVLSGVVK